MSLCLLIYKASPQIRPLFKGKWNSRDVGAFKTKKEHLAVGKFAANCYNWPSQNIDFLFESVTKI